MRISYTCKFNNLETFIAKPFSSANRILNMVISDDIFYPPCIKIAPKKAYANILLEIDTQVQKRLYKFFTSFSVRHTFAHHAFILPTYHKIFMLKVLAW